MGGKHKLRNNEHHSRLHSTSIDNQPSASLTTKTSQKINGTIEAGATVSVITEIAVSDGFATVSRTTWNYTIPGLVVFPNKLSSEAHSLHSCGLQAAYLLPNP